MSKQTLVVPLQPGIGLESFKRVLADPFAEAYGVEVRTPERSERFVDEVAADVRAGKRTYDVVEWPQYDLRRVKAEGLSEPIDYGRLPSVAQVDPRYLDPDGHGVGVFVYGMAPIFVPQSVPRPIASWSDLWDPAFKGAVALRDQLVAGKLMAIACKVLGVTTDDLVRDDVYEAAWAKLVALVANAGHWGSSEGHIQELIARRQVAVSHQFIDVAQIQKERGVAIEVTFPSEGAIWAYRSWTIVRGTRNRDLAEAFIDFAQSADRQKALIETFYGLPTNATVAPSENTVAKLFGGGPAQPVSFPSWDWYFARRADADERWRRLGGLATDPSTPD